MVQAEKTLQEALGAFDFGAPVISADRYGSGHINDTFCVLCRVANGVDRRFILQRINSAIFHDPGKLMDNIVRITEHMATQILRAGGDRSREALEVLYTIDGRAFYTDTYGNCWRVFPFVEGSCCYQQADTPELFEASAKAFGHFQQLLSDFPAETLYETIPRFHDTQDRLRKLKRSVSADTVGRAAQCSDEIRFAMDREADCSIALQAQRNGILPTRVTHNDTKLNNILMDASTGKGLCIIDLDTTMPGLAINDFGDSIRFGANHNAEDEKDLSKVNFDISLYESYTRGFLEGAGGSLTPAELEYLPWGARLMTLECGIRFLTDYLDGDTYFHTSYPEQNLDRCRTQFKLVRDMEAQFGAMRQIVAKYASR